MENKVSKLNSKSRNKNLKKNIIFSFGLKFLSFIFNFLLVPITINYLNSDEYGIWITLLSILSWMSFADIGLGNGLRNKLTESLSNKKFKDAKEYIATTYASLAVIVLALYIIMLIIIPHLNWQSIFNSKVISNSQLNVLVIIVFSCFLFNFVLSLYNQLYYAVQKAAVTGIGQFMLNLISLVNLIVLTKFTKGNIIYVSISYGISMIIPSIFLTYLFFYAYKSLRPKIKYIKIDKIKSIMSLGIKFFIVQIAAVVYFCTNNFIIIQICGPKEVSVYDTTYKLFNGIITVFGLLLAPLWSAFTEAYCKKDFSWIKKVIKRLNRLLIPISIVLLLICIFSKLIFKIWIGNKLTIPQNLVIADAIYCLIYVWTNIYTYFLNGVNKLNLQIYISIFICIVNIPLCMYFGKTLKLNSFGIEIAQIITEIPSAIMMPWQVYKIISGDKNDKQNN